MNIDILLPLIITSILTVLSWGILHFLSKRRDLLNKKKEIRINYLIQAWRLLETASNRDNQVLHSNIETAIADIQLFGTRRQIELAQKFAKEMATHKSVSYLELLILLREDLRDELNLESVPNKFKFLRFKRGSNFID